jgi:hypothetical protein
MNENFKAICRFLKTRKQRFRANSDYHFIDGVGVIVDGMAVRLAFHAPPHAPVVRFWWNPAVNVPNERRQQVGEYLHRISLGVSYIPFVLNPDDGAVFLVLTSLLLPDYTISEELIDEWLRVGTFYLRGVMPVLMRVAFGNLSPASAVEQTDGVFKNDLSKKGLLEE